MEFFKLDHCRIFSNWTIAGFFQKMRKEEQKRVLHALTRQTSKNHPAFPIGNAGQTHIGSCTIPLPTKRNSI